MTLRLGTRGSALALAQSTLVAEAIEAALGEPVELVEIVTDGDRSTAPVASLGVGVFVSALRDALQAKDIDIAVHSYKDLPTAAVEGLTIAAIPAREDPRDALVSRTGSSLMELPERSRIGTGAARRVAQLRALGRGLECVPLRGNVDTRLRRVAEGDLDAVVLAAAGVRRLGRADAITELLDPEVLLPAPAQGALAVECRTGDHSLVEQLACLNDEHSRAAVAAERSFLATLEAGCSAPVAALAVVVQATSSDRRDRSTVDSSTVDSSTVDGAVWLHLRGAVFEPGGAHAVRRDATGPLSDATGLGTRLAAQLLDEGADLLLGETA